jgi:FMN reductase
VNPLSVVAVSAGLGTPSATRLLTDRLAEATAGHLTGRGRAPQVTVIELRELATDIAAALVTGFPGARLRTALEAVAAAHGLIAVTPIFSASYSGLFKSFFDVVDNTALAGTPVLIAATGGTPRHSLALEHAMRPLFSYLRAVVVPTGVYAASQDWGEAGDGRTGDLAARITRAAGELAALIRDRPAPAAEAETVVPFEEQLSALRPE